MSAAQTAPPARPPNHVKSSEPRPASAPAPALPHLAVAFAPDPTGRTFIARQRARHPYHLCRALYRPDDPPGLATLYVQGCSGGIFEGDRLHLALEARAGARAHVTTAAATIVHRMPGGDEASQSTRLRVGPDALLEYWPDPLILFPGSRLRTRLDVELEPGGRLLAADAFLPHRLPDDDGVFDWLDGETRVSEPGGRLLARERFRASGTALRDGAPGVTGGRPCQATVLVLGAGAAPLPALRALARRLEDPAPATEDATPPRGPDEPSRTEGLYAGATALPGETGVLVRVLASDGVRLRAALLAIWQTSREALGVVAGRARPK